jgi:hypothetical protein
MRQTNLFKLRVFRFRSDESRNVRVGFLPKREEILIRRFSFGGVTLHGIGSADLEMRECCFTLEKTCSAAWFCHC